MEIELSNEVTVAVNETNDQALFPELLAVIDEMVAHETAMRHHRSNGEYERDTVVLEVLDPDNHRSVEIGLPMDGFHGYMLRGFWKHGSIAPKSVEHADKSGEQIIEFLVD